MASSYSYSDKDTNTHYVYAYLKLTNWEDNTICQDVISLDASEIYEAGYEAGWYSAYGKCGVSGSWKGLTVKTPSWNVDEVDTMTITPEVSDSHWAKLVVETDDYGTSYSAELKGSSYGYLSWSYD
jgi:hypothetical protein